jgi:hypothetical protein
MTEIIIETNSSTWRQILEHCQNPENVTKILDGDFKYPILRDTGINDDDIVSFVSFNPFTYDHNQVKYTRANAKYPSYTSILDWDEWCDAYDKMEAQAFNEG